MRDEFRRVQRNLLFLYYLHKQPNMRALMDREALQLRVIILIKEIRGLVIEKHDLDQMRLTRVNLEGKRHPRPEKVKQRAKALYQTHADAWPVEAQEVLARVPTFLAAVQMISRRYFAGEDILFPETRENLSCNLTNIANLKEMYADSILGGSPESDDGFRDYVLALVGDGRENEKGRPAVAAGHGSSEFAHEARLLAEQWILMARSEALEGLGEYPAAQALAERLIRQAL